MVCYLYIGIINRIEKLILCKNYWGVNLKLRGKIVCTENQWILE